MIPDDLWDNKLDSRGLDYIHDFTQEVGRAVKAILNDSL